MFTENDYKTLHELVFRDDYAGYKPNVVESPDGNGVWDTEKRYAHIANKYFTMNTPFILGTYLERANNLAIDVAIKLGVPQEFWPDVRYGAMRILEYPPGAVTNPHKDFDLFTLMLYRNIPECFQYVQELPPKIERKKAKHFGEEDAYYPELTKYKMNQIKHNKRLEEANKLNSQIHFGELLELINPEYQATKHEVVADKLNRTQYSIVYFGIPNHKAVLPSGISVGDWLDERLQRSRKAVEE